MARFPDPELAPLGGVRALGAVTLVLLLAGCGKSPSQPRVFPPIASVTVSPETLTVRVGESLAFSAVARDSNGLAVVGAPFTWSSSDTGALIFSVNAAGRVTGRGEGSALVFAESGGVRATGVVVVKPTTRGWFTQASNANGVDLNGLFFLPDGRTGWVVGDAGKILKTSDAGVAWTVQVSNTSFSLNAVWFTSPTRGWAVGNNGTVLRTSDGGQNWTRLDAGASETLFDVHFATDSLGWVVGGAGLILRTTDRGASWRRTLTTPANLRSVSFAGTQDGWAVGDNGIIVGTHDRGESWFVVQPSVTSQNLKAVWRRSEPVAFAAGAQGVTPRTVVQDSTRWQLQNAGAANQLEGIHFPTALTGFAVGFNGVGAVLHTDDGGVSWRAQTSNTQFRLNAVFAVDPDRVWAVGENGTIIHTGTGGAP